MDPVQISSLRGSLLAVRATEDYRRFLTTVARKEEYESLEPVLAGSLVLQRVKQLTTEDDPLIIEVLPEFWTFVRRVRSGLELLT